MKEKHGNVPAEEFLNHVFGLPLAPFDVDRLQYCNNVLEKKLRVIGPLPDLVSFVVGI